MDIEKDPKTNKLKIIPTPHPRTKLFKSIPFLLTFASALTGFIYLAGIREINAEAFSSWINTSGNNVTPPTGYDIGSFSIVVCFISFLWFIFSYFLELKKHKKDIEKINKFYNA